ncbi:protein ImuA [Lacibacter cauensis]|uniref:Protein ImuA n=1 Tax=Lacibacter cauensis TaxID=510947 RepID=A0A562SXE7_9BACT|nr:Error-prone repair protein ImuA [Lacibacter cauensis]TWI85823.1 protein ImuA [Lacibacter cauensis]
MLPAKAYIIAQLQKDLLKLSGMKPAGHASDLPKGLGFLKDHLPQANFPTAAVHEFVCANKEGVAATEGFVSALVSTITHPDAITVWLSPGKTLFPPAIKLFGLDPDRIIFIQLHQEKELLWATEEALKCRGLAAVVCELQELSFTSSRRLQLAVEQSAVTGFILRVNPRKLTATTCVSRWRISSIASETNGMPGVGFPKWDVELLKMRNGKPGSWEVEWKENRFHLHEHIAAVEPQLHRKTG